MRSEEFDHSGNQHCDNEESLRPTADRARQSSGEARPAEQLEAMLHQGLQRRAAPEGLEERILARAMAARQTSAVTRSSALASVRPTMRRVPGLLRFASDRQPFSGRGLPGRGWAIQRIAASVALGAVVAGVAAYYQTEQRRLVEAARAEQARDQVMEALRITSRTLDRVQDHLNDQP